MDLVVRLVHTLLRLEGVRQCVVFVYFVYRGCLLDGLFDGLPAWPLRRNFVFGQVLHRANTK